MQDSTPMLRDLWQRLGLTPIRLGLLLFVAFAAMRAYGYFGADSLKTVPIMLSFVGMWAIPAFFLTSQGSRQIGLTRARGVLWLPVAALVGISSAYACYLLGYLLFGYSENNWFVNIGYTYASDPRFAQMPQRVAFAVFTIPALVFSPLGEEIFFRGLINEAFRQRWGRLAGLYGNAALFALVHLVHHGIVRSNDGYHALWLSGALWMGLMFATSVAFALLRERFASVWPCVVAHAAFNLTMNYTIFFSLFVHNPVQTN